MEFCVYSLYQDVDQALLSLNNKRSFILQPFLKEHSIWRVIVTKHQGIIASYLKEGQGPVLAISNGAERVYKEPTKEVKELSEKMFQVGSGNASGCDIIESGGQFYPLEINNNFGIDLDNKSLLNSFRIECEKIIKS